MDQVKILNSVFIGRDECMEINDSLNSSILTYAKLVLKEKVLNINLENQISLNEDVISEKDNQITACNRLIKSLVIQRNCIAVLTIILGVTLIL